MDVFPIYDADTVRAFERFYDITSVEISAEGHISAIVRVLPRHKEGAFLQHYRDEAMQILHFRYAPFTSRRKFVEGASVKLIFDPDLLNGSGRASASG